MNGEGSFDRVRFSDVEMGEEFIFMGTGLLRIEECMNKDAEKCNAVVLRWVRGKERGKLMFVPDDRWVDRQRKVVPFRLRG